MSLSIVILAGRRSGIHDPLAKAAGVSHKCLVPVAGVPMIQRVLRTVSRAMPNSRVAVCVDDVGVVADLPEVRALRDEGRLVLVEAADNLFDSVKAVAAALPPPFAITTADNVLVTPSALRQMEQFTRTGDAEAAFTMARKEDIQRVHPKGQRRFYEFRDGEFANCNMYYVASEKALAAAAAFREGGQFLKVPQRIVRAFGVLNLLAFRFKLRTIDATARAVGRRFGVRLRVLVFEDGRLAIDVDSEASKAVTEEILAREATSVPA